MPNRWGWTAAPIAAAVAFTVYVRTLAPGLIAITDTPKFQFIGKILGTAHNPGYPLYVVISHLFGYLPLGSLAWRINLLSALFASAGIGAFVLTLIAIGCAPVIAVTAALALAFGSAFWMTATIAEVYSLHFLLVSAMTYLLVRWRQSERPAMFFGAVGVFALALGHHTTIVLLAPAIAAFAIVTSPRFVLRPRTIALATLIVAAGLSQYLFVLVRTLQGAWVESPARTLRELVDVVRGAQFSGALAPLGVETLWRRSPDILRLVANEVSPLACAVATCGALVLLARDGALAVLSGLSVFAVIAFGVFFRVPDITLFMLPAYFFIWLLAAVGAGAAATLLLRRRAWATIAAGAVMSTLAAWQYTRNIDARDLSHDRGVMRHFEALFRDLPERSAILSEDFLVDRMVYYKTLGEDTARGRDILAPVGVSPGRVRTLAEQGYHVFAFEKTARGLREAGAEFAYASWPLTYGTLRRFLIDQPKGTVVAIAVPAAQIGAALEHDAVPLDVIGGRRVEPSWANVTAIGSVGRSGAIQRQERETAVVSTVHGTSIGTTGAMARADIFAEAAYDAAVIRVGSRELIRSGEAPVVAVWDTRGGLRHAFALRADGCVPIAQGPLSVRILRQIRAWTRISGPTPVDITHAASSGHLMVDATRSAGSLVFYAGRDRSLSPILLEASLDSPALVVESFTGGSPELAAALARDGWPADQRLDRLRHVYRVRVPHRDRVVHVGFGGLPAVALARTADQGSVANVYGLDLTGQLEPIDRRTARVHVARDHHAFFLGAGWSPVAADHAGAFRATTSTRAEIAIPCSPGDCLAVSLQLRPVGAAGPLALMVNDTDLGAQWIAPEWNRYRWNVPPSSLRDGMNSFVLTPGEPVLLADVLVSTR